MKSRYSLLFVLVATFISAFAALPNTPPKLYEIEDQIAVAGQIFETDIKAIDYDKDYLVFYDNSELFDINKETGKIYFTPKKEQVGEYEINIIASDSIAQDSKIMRLSIYPNLSSNVEDLSIDKSLLRALTVIGQTKKTNITIRNIGTDYLKTDVNLNSLKEKLYLGQHSFILKPGEARIIEIYINPVEESGAFTGAIDFVVGLRKISVPLIVEAESDNKLADISLNIPPEKRAAKAGEKLVAEVKIIKIGLSGDEEATLFYELKDFENNLVYNKSEKISIITSEYYTDEILLPDYLAAGNYVLIAKILYTDGGVSTTGTSTDIIRITGVDEENLLKPGIIENIIYIFVLALIFGVIVVVVSGHKKVINVEKDIARKKINELKSKIRKKEGLLEKAYQLHLIRKESYEAGKARLERLLNQAKNGKFNK